MTRHLVVVMLWVAACSVPPNGTVEQEVSAAGDQLLGPERDCVHAFNPSAQCSLDDASRCMEVVAGNSGFSVQKFFDFHCEVLAACASDGEASGPGRIDAVRLCGEPGVETACGITGPKGCAPCGPVHVTCD